jgi:hypothetical protein
MQPNTLTRLKNKSKIYVKKKIHVGSETNLKVGFGSEKNHSGSTTLLATPILHRCYEKNMFRLNTDDFVCISQVEKKLTYSLQVH